MLPGSTGSLPSESSRLPGSSLEAGCPSSVPPFPSGRRAAWKCRPNNHRNAHTLMSSEHNHSHTDVQRTLPLTHTDIQRTQTLHQPHTITTHYRQQRYLKGRNNGHTQIIDILYTRFRHRLRSRTPQIQHKGTQLTRTKGTLGSRDSNTELPHKASYWITLLSSPQSNFRYLKSTEKVPIWYN